MRRISKSDWVAIAGFFLMFQMICFWCIDVSVSALINQGTMVNAFFSANPNTTYHIALYGNLLTTFILFMVIVHLVIKDEHKQ